MYVIGYNLLGDEDSRLFDTPIPTNQLDDLIIGEGIYDEIYISLDTTISKVNQRPEGWFLKNIMNAKFQNDLESGSLDADGHDITQIQIYRRQFGDNSDKWILIGRFKYDIDYNMYSFLDVTAENDKYYEYALVPIAGTVIGEKNMTEPVYVEYSGIFISDLQNNFKLKFDYDQGEITYNKNFASFNPLNGEFPVVVYGNQNYRTGNVSFLPLSNEQIESGGMKINPRSEKEIRNSVTSFLNNGKAKILRNANGDIMIIATNNIKSAVKSQYLPDIQSVSFDYTELGRVDSNTLVSNGLVGDVVKSNYTYDAYGNIVWDLRT